MKTGVILPEKPIQTMLAMVIALMFFCTQQVGADPVIDDYHERADRSRLAEHPGWTALLHYQQELTGGFVSQADDPAFFLSQHGASDPEAELHAAIDAFTEAGRKGHAQCLFPARWFWLKQQLGIRDHQYDVSCPKLESWMQRAAADGVSLVFPAMFLNNPGSMFGHTFLRFDNRERPELLAYTLNYAARNDPDDSFLSYAYKGLTGGYRGVFATRPYYETVQLYSDIENRDIWEYELDYSTEEVTQLLRHTWEVTNIRFDYYFLKENCAYRLLALLDAVKPSAQLSSIDSFAVYAIPVDTVRALDDAGLILSSRYRPSLASSIDQLVGVMSEDDTDTSIALAAGEIRVDDPDIVETDRDRVRILEQAYDMLRFRGEEDSPVADDVLSARARLPAFARPSIESTAPEEGHRSIMAALGFGEIGSASFAGLRLRPAFHDLIDDPEGFVSGAEINVLDTEIRLSEDEVVLDRLRLFNIVSLAPVQPWRTAISWRIDIELDRELLATGAQTTMFELAGAAGSSIRWSGLIVYGMAGFAVDASRELSDGFSLQAELHAGLYYPFGPGQLHIGVVESESIAGADREGHSLSAEIQFNIDRGTALHLGLEDERMEGIERERWSVSLKRYY